MSSRFVGEGNINKKKLTYDFFLSLLLLFHSTGIASLVSNFKRRHQQTMTTTMATITTNNKNGDNFSDFGYHTVILPQKKNPSGCPNVDGLRSMHIQKRAGGNCGSLLPVVVVS